MPEHNAPRPVPSHLRIFGQVKLGSARLLIGIAAILGGLIWSATVILTALRPVGVPGAHRSTLDLHPTILVSFILMGIAGTALTRIGPKTLPVRSGVALLWLGVMMFSVNVAFILATGDDAPVWPTHYLSILCVALGTSILGIVISRARTVPSWVGMVMVAASAVLPFSHMQDWRVLLWLPLGMGWLAVGLLMRWRRGSHGT